MEYIGEVLTHDEAHERGIEYDLSNFRLRLLMVTVLDSTQFYNFGWFTAGH